MKLTGIVRFGGILDKLSCVREVLRSFSRAFMASEMCFTPSSEIVFHDKLRFLREEFFSDAI